MGICCVNGAFQGQRKHITSMRIERGNLGYDLGKIWCILVGKLGRTKRANMATRVIVLLVQNMINQRERQ